MQIPQHKCKSHNAKTEGLGPNHFWYRTIAREPGGKTERKFTKMARNVEQRALIEKYFHQGYENKVILAFLEAYHEIRISLSTLKRRLHDYGLNRRGSDINNSSLRDLILQEMAGPGELRGYRAIWLSLRFVHHIHVPRQRVAELLKEINPEASEQRRRRRLVRRQYSSYGPNFCWHVDGKVRFNRSV